MAGTSLFADINDPMSENKGGEEVKHLLMTAVTTRLQRSAPAHGVRTILAFLGMPCRWHDEQCTLAEFSAYIVRDVMAHVDLAAEARVTKSHKPVGDCRVRAPIGGRRPEPPDHPRRRVGLHGW